MRDVIESIAAHLSANGMVTHYLTAPDLTPWPYALLWGFGGRIDRPSFAAHEDLADTLSVTWVSKSALGCLDLVAHGRGLLAGFVPTSAVWQMAPLVLRAGEGQPVEPDRTVSLPDTGLPPYYAVDRYQVSGYRLT